LTQRLVSGIIPDTMQKLHGLELRAGPPQFHRGTTGGPTPDEKTNTQPP